MTVSEVREIYPRPEGAAVQKRWRKLDRFMRAFIKRSPFLCLGAANAAGALSQRRRLSGAKCPTPRQSFRRQRTWVYPAETPLVA